MPGMNFVRGTAALLGVLTLVSVPAAADAADPTPPRGCKTTTGYSEDGSYRGELKICLTTHRKYSSGEGREWDSPAVTVEAHCYSRIVFWSEQGSCDWRGQLSMAKDGVQVWKEPWGKKTEATHSGDRTAYDFYQCRGYGTYALTLDSIHMLSSNNGIQNDWHQVFPSAVTLTAKGC